MEEWEVRIPKVDLKTEGILRDSSEIADRTIF